MSGARHLTELEIAASLLPGAAPVSCAVPGCVDCAARLASARQAADEFQAHVLPRTLPGLRARAARPAVAWWRRWTRPALLGPLVAAAALATLLWWPRGPAEVSLDAGADLRIKGPAERVRVYARRAGQVQRLEPGAQVQPGDALRVVVEPRGARYLLILSVDGALQRSVYHPLDGTASAALPPGAAEVELDGSLVLDATLGPERLWILFSAQPLQVAQVQARLEALIAGGAQAVLDAGEDALSAGLADVEAMTWSWRKVAPAGGAPAP